MTLTLGTRLGVYEVTARIGEGGMGQVYRATDTKLKRQVALKILPPSVAADAERLARFQREAEVLASLNHSNIAQIYGLEDANGVKTLVMELVEGEDLSQRIGRGAIPMDEALPIAKQIAEALEAAHERGIIHRDLKPANIKVRADGTVKVLDFGLAKAVDPTSSDVAAALANSPTITSPAITAQGIILGTAAYMAPEQARGRPVDKRADIWAFGVVVFEMLAGKPLFAGASVTETLASIIKDEPDLKALPASTPSNVRRLLAQCLVRDPKIRMRDIGDARIVLSNNNQDVNDEIEPTERVRARTARRHLLPWSIAILATVAVVALGISAWRTLAVGSRVVRRFELGPDVASAREFALAPDGTRVAYLNHGQLLIRRFDSLQSRDLGAAPANTSGLVWSPDSQTIAFSSEGMLRSMPASGGTVFNICKVPATGQILGAAWREDGTIVFSTWRDSLYRVPARGGTPDVYLKVDAAREVDFHFISALPDNRVIIGTHLQADGWQTEIFDGKTRKVLATGHDLVAYAWPGYLMVARQGENKGLWALPFSDGPLDFAKAALVEPDATFFDTSSEGTALVFVPPETGTRSEFVWVDRAGAVKTTTGKPVAIAGFPALAPDGRRVAFAERSPSDVFVRDLASGVDTRLTFEGKPKASVGWFPSGDRIFYSEGTVEAERIVARQADGSGNERDLGPGQQARVSPDGRSLFVLVDQRGRGRLRQASIAADGTIGARERIFADENEPDVMTFDSSPDGRLLVYAARTSTARIDVLLTTVNGSGRWEVATDAGVPRFSRDGKELFYVVNSRDAANQVRTQLMDVPVTSSTPAIKLGASTALLDFSKLSWWFDVSPNGQQLLMARRVAEAADERHVVLIQNWPTVIKK